MVFKNKKRPKDENEVAVYISDYNIWKLPVKRRINDFVKQKFSILIDLTNGDNRAVEYISALSNAEFLVGSNPKSKVFDLIIAQNFVNSGDLINEIEKTLRNLSSKA
ncbi:MAG TPA: hypothetical protein VJ909_01100 [Prolixibacteraceae bacterium]|nr:hypothetical protein [Prolixibacteraceae bacterium]